MSSAMTYSLPGVSWTEDNFITTSKGKRLSKRGSVQKACEILDGCDRSTIYDLLEAKVIRGYKAGIGKNAHWKVDLVSVWEHKQRQQHR
jgi:hypothetical protein